MRRLQNSTKLWLWWKTNLGVDENDIEDLLEVVFEELTNELLEVEQDHIAEEEARKKETSGEEKEEPPK